MSANKPKRDWEEWDRVVGYKLTGTLAGSGPEPLLTENGWAKQHIEQLIEQEVRKTIDTHNLIAIAQGKVSDGEYYNKQVKERVERLISDLTHVRDQNDKLIGNLRALVSSKSVSK